MPSDDLLRKLAEGGFLKEHPKDVGQAKKLLARSFRDLKTAQEFVQQILKQARKESPQLELDFPARS